MTEKAKVISHVEEQIYSMQRKQLPVISLFPHMVICLQHDETTANEQNTKGLIWLKLWSDKQITRQKEIEDESNEFQKATRFQIKKTIPINVEQG